MYNRDSVKNRKFTPLLAFTLILIPITFSMLFVNGILSLFYHYPITCVLFIIPLGFSIFCTISYWQNSTKQATILKKIKTILLINFIILSSFYSTAFIIPLAQKGDTSSRLIWVDRVGKYGLSDLAVLWNSEESTKNTLYWSNGETEFQISEEISKKDHIFIMNDLDFDTTYWYRINHNPHIEFTTPKRNDFSLAFLSDLHFGSSNAKIDDIGKIINGINADSVFLLGDFVDFGYLDHQWKFGLNEMNPLISKTPTKFLVGNHDALMVGDTLYKKYWFPQINNTISKEYGKITIGDVHIIYLHFEWDHRDYMGNQQIWLENTLIHINKEDTVIILSHSPFLSSYYGELGSPKLDLPNYLGYFTTLFESNGVDLVISGHQHLSEHLYKSGVNYNIVGLSGDVSRDKVISENQQSLWSWEEGASYMNVNFGESMVVNYLNADSEVVYSYII